MDDILGAVSKRTNQDDDADEISEDEDETGGATGTPLFLPPEALMMKKYPGQPADIWSTGVTLFMFVFGQPQNPSESF